MAWTSDIAMAGARAARGGPGAVGRIMQGGRDRAPAGVEAGWGPGRVRPERLDTR